MNDSSRMLLEKNRFWLSSRYCTIGKWMALSGMLYLAVRFVNLTDVVASFALVSPPTLISIFILILLSKFLYAFRWRLICTNGLGLCNISSLFLLRINLLGEFVGIAMPSSLGGEAARVLKLSAHTGTAARATASIVADRLIGAISMGLIVLVLLPKLGMSIAGRLPLSTASLLIVVVVSIGGIGAAILWLRQRDRRMQLPRAIQQIEFSPSLLVALPLLSVGGHLIFASGYYLLFREIQPFPLLVIVALVLTAQLARSVPISLLGIGLSEGSMVALASLIGMKHETALAVVVIAVGVRYVFAICGLLIELACDGKVFLNTMTEHMNANADMSQ